MGAMQLNAITGLLRGITGAMSEGQNRQFREQTEQQRLGMDMEKQELNQRYMQAMIDKMQGGDMVSPEQMAPIAQAYGAEPPTSPMSRSLIPHLTGGWQQNRTVQRLNNKERNEAKKEIWKEARSLRSANEKLKKALRADPYMEDSAKQDIQESIDENIARFENLEMTYNDMGFKLPLTKIVMPEKEALDQEQAEIGQPAISGLGGMIGPALQKIKSLFNRGQQPQIPAELPPPQ